jgi:membrane protein implicated in regulation of membrane protease activity
MNRLRMLPVLLAVTLFSAGCELVGGLIEFGFWTAIVLLIVIVLVLGWIWRRLRGRGRRL